MKAVDDFHATSNKSTIVIVAWVVHVDDYRWLGVIIAVVKFVRCSNGLCVRILVLS